MPSGNDARRWVTMVAATSLFALCGPDVIAQEAVEAAVSETITARDIELALEKVKSDPDLATERTTRTLRWIDSGEKKKAQRPGWLQSLFRWLSDLFGFLSQQGRFLFWGVLALLAALIVIYLWRLFRAHGMPARARQFEAPSHVRDLDIRPESLPDDIGGVARKLWDEGEHRAALALLYRGLLSRLVHVHGVPIRDSTTEGDCMALASAHLTSTERSLYVTSLVRVWQRAVYGGESIPTESVHTLCAEFARALDAPESTGPQPGGASAEVPA